MISSYILDKMTENTINKHKSSHVPLPENNNTKYILKIKLSKIRKGLCLTSKSVSLISNHWWCDYLDYLFGWGFYTSLFAANLSAQFIRVKSGNQHPR